MQNSLNIIGCGRLGRTLGYLWARSGAVLVRDISARSQQSAQEASKFIGTGNAVATVALLNSADIYLIATPDDHIEQTCLALATSGRFSTSSIVFHCSGALGSDVLSSAAQHGAAIASVHPIRSFAVPEQLIHDFSGTFCGAEGDASALEILDNIFSAIGATLIKIDSTHKVFYHAAAVFASNYMVTLLDLAQQAYIKAGITPDMALKMIAPLVRESTENVLRLGPKAALTGPIARGDMNTVARQQKAVNAWNKGYGNLYRDFVELTVNLAAKRPH